MSQPDQFSPIITWRRGFTNPSREPVEVDVQDGRAEYLLSGPYRMSEGAKVEIVRGRVLCSSGSSLPQRCFLEDVRLLPAEPLE